MNVLKLKRWTCWIGFCSLWVDDTYSKYGGKLHLKDWFNNPKILLDPVLLNAMIRNFITKPAQNVDTHVAEAVSLC